MKVKKVGFTTCFLVRLPAFLKLNDTLSSQPPEVLQLGWIRPVYQSVTTTRVHSKVFSECSTSIILSKCYTLKCSTFIILSKCYTLKCSTFIILSKCYTLKCFTLNKFSKCYSPKSVLLPKILKVLFPQKVFYFQKFSKCNTFKCSSFNNSQSVIP